MKCHSRIAGAALLTSLMTLNFPPASAQVPCQVIGTINVSGSKAFRNSEKLKKNAKDVPLCNGDEVRTEARSSAVIRTPANQTVQTDQNTSLFAKVGGGITQLLLWLRDGQAVIVGKDVEITTAELAAGLGSTVNVRIDNAGSTLTVIDGHATVTRPTSVVANANERYVATNAGMVQHDPISAEEARRSVDWTKDYFKPSSGFWKKFWIATGIVVAGAVIHEATDGNDKPSPQPPASEDPTPVGDQPQEPPPQVEARTPAPVTPPSPTITCCQHTSDGWRTIQTTTQSCRGTVLSSPNDLCPPVR